MRRNPMFGKHLRGGTLVETAMVLPMVMLILLGIIEYGRYYYIQTVLSNAAREGARFGVTHPTNTSGIAGAARRLTVGLGGAAVGITVSTPNGTKSGDPMRVTVSYTTRLFIPYPFGKALKIVKKTTMQIE